MAIKFQLIKIKNLVLPFDHFRAFQVLTCLMAISNSTVLENQPECWMQNRLKAAKCGMKQGRDQAGGHF